jgi:hypothetical protein
MYDLCNSQFHGTAIHRAKELEKALAPCRLSAKGAAGDLMNERPRDRYRLAGVEVWHDRALFVLLIIVWPITCLPRLRPWWPDLARRR